jgi:hypothetical protein
MTITDNGRRTVDQLVAEARGMAKGGRVPSPTALKASLRIGWERATEVHEAASRSIDAEREARRRESRTALKRLGSKRRSGRPAIITLPPSRTRLDEPAPTVVDSAIDLDLETAPERVEDAPRVAALTPSPVHDYAVPIGPMPMATDAVRRRRPKSWLLVGVMVSASVAIWGGWVDLGRLTGFGVVHPFPGIPKLDALTVNLAITLPVGLEAYAAYALSVWLSAYVPAAARRFARWSAIFSLALGFAGQATYHLMIAAGWTQAPWWITLLVSGVPVGVAGLAATLRHLVHAEEA